MAVFNYFKSWLRLRDHSDLQGKLEEFEITNKRLLDDNTKLKQEVFLVVIFIIYLCVNRSS